MRQHDLGSNDLLPFPMITNSLLSYNIQKQPDMFFFLVSKCKESDKTKGKENNLHIKMSKTVGFEEFYNNK